MNVVKKSGGFTLVELIVVLAVLAILAAAAVPAYSGYIKKAQEAKDLQVISAVNSAIRGSNAINDAAVTDAKLVDGRITLTWRSGDDSDDSASNDYQLYMTGNEEMKLTYYADVELVDGLIVGIAPS